MKITPGLIFCSGGLIGIFSWLLALNDCLYGVTVSQLEPLYTGLGFVGLVATFWHERDKSEEGNQQHDELLAAMTKQAEASTRLVEVTLHQAKISALIARIESYDVQLNAVSGDFFTPIQKQVDPRYQKLLTEKTDLIKRLDVLMQ